MRRQLAPADLYLFSSLFLFVFLPAFLLLYVSLAARDWRRRGLVVLLCAAGSLAAALLAAPTRRAAALKSSGLSWLARNSSSRP